MRFTQLIVWILVGLTFGLVNMDPNLKLTTAFVLLKLAIECALLFLAAYQIFKPSETQAHQFEHVITFRKRSSRFYHLIGMGVVLMLADFVLIEHYRELLSSDSILAAILFLYYFGQMLNQNRPKVLLGNSSLIYDDYFPRRWPWSAIRAVQIDEEHMVISDHQQDFKISLQGADELDPARTKVELAAEVLDGSVHFVDDATNFRTLLQRSAEKHGFPIRLGE